MTKPIKTRLQVSPVFPIGNMPAVIIAEKPSVAADIAHTLNVKKKMETHWESDEIIVTWAVGHLLELRTPEEYDESFKNWHKSLDKLPFIPSEFQLKPIGGRGSNKKQLTDFDILCVIEGCIVVVVVI